MNAKTNIYDFLRQRGLHFPSELVTTYLLSLKTKPFVILSGISGTGKTKLAQAVAEWAGTEERVVEEEEPSWPPAKDGSWLYQLKPYNFSHGAVYIPREREALMDLHAEGTVALPITFEDERFDGRLGAVKSKDRTLWQIRFGMKLGARIAASLSTGDYVSFTPALSGDQQTIKIERVTKERRTRKEVIHRHEFVSVRPDWLDGKEVLGFYNVLTEEYATRPSC